MRRIVVCMIAMLVTGGSSDDREEDASFLSEAGVPYSVKSRD